MGRLVYISNGILSLVSYEPRDDRALYDDWLDPETREGYNSAHVTTFEDFQKEETRQRFFAMIRTDKTDLMIGAVGISPPGTVPDLAIWIFKPYRRRGYGTSAFALATKYIVEVLKINELHAGAYENNTGSKKMLKRCGYIPNPAGNIREKHYITGEEIIQMDYIYRPVTLRPAVPADAPDIAEVHMRSWEAAYKDIIPADYIREKNASRPEMWKNSLAERRYPHQVIELNGKTVGMMCVAAPQDDDLDETYYELHGIYLHPDYFRRGVGTQAIKLGVEAARELGKKSMTVWVFADNTGSIMFYKKCGFAPDGKTKILNLGKPLTAIRMKKELL